MNQNKTTKYFKYAIGEIILVVIGILIALQINNWNEEHKSQLISKEFHQRFADELGAKSINFENDAKRATQLVDYIGQTVQILRKGEITSSGKDTLNFTLGRYFQFVRIEGELKTFQEMESTGQLGLIYSKELKDKTLEYLTFLEAISKTYDQMGNQINNTEIIDQHVALILDPKSINSTLDYNFEDLSKDQYLINRMARFGYFWQTKQHFSNLLSESSRNLKELYLKELSKM